MNEYEKSSVWLVHVFNVLQKFALITVEHTLSHFKIRKQVAQFLVMQRSLLFFNSVQSENQNVFLNVCTFLEGCLKCNDK